MTSLYADVCLLRMVVALFGLLSGPPSLYPLSLSGWLLAQHRCGALQGGSLERKSRPSSGEFPSSKQHCSLDFVLRNDEGESSSWPGMYIDLNQGDQATPVLGSKLRGNPDLTSEGGRGHPPNTPQPSLKESNQRGRKGEAKKDS